MQEKSKSSPVPPDIRLAKAFKFTAEDLATNRSGYISRRQENSADVDYAISWLLNRVFPSRVAKPKREFRSVNSECGRAKLAHFVVDRPVRPSKMSRGFWECYHLMFDDEDLKFVISAEQYQTLAEGIIYRAYYDAAKPDKVLSIERPDGGCETA
jgi:hypothetical protein